MSAVLFRFGYETAKFIFSYLCIGSFIARQHANACKARYCDGKCVCQSVRHTLILYLEECTYHQTFSAFWLGHVFF